MKDLIEKYNEYRIHTIWDYVNGASALEKFGAAVLDYDVNQLRLPAPTENAKSDVVFNSLLQQYEILRDLQTKLSKYAVMINYPIDLQRNGKLIKQELRKKLAEMQQIITRELLNIPLAIAEILATVRFPNYSVEQAKTEVSKKSTKVFELLEINLSSLANEKNYLIKIKQLAKDLNEQKKLIQAIFYTMSLQITGTVRNKELRENVLSCLMPNADKLIIAVNKRLCEIAKELIRKDPKVFALVSSINEVGTFNRILQESDEAYLERLKNLNLKVQTSFANLKIINEVTKTHINELGLTADDSVLIQEIANFSAQLIIEQRSKLKFALDQIEDITKDIKRPLRKLIDKAANDLAGPNAGTPKIILVTYHSSDREILGVPSGDHTGIILCGGGREPLCLSFYGNRRIVISEKTGLEGFILKTLHIPSKIIAGHFRDIDTEISNFEQAEQTTADTVVLECGDDIGLNFDAVYHWAQEQINNPKDYDFRTSNCAAIGIGALKKGLEGNEKNKEYNQLLEKSKTLGTVVPQQLHNCAKEIEDDIAIRRNRKFAIQLANDESNLIPQQNDAIKTEIIAFQSELEVRIRALKQIQEQERANPLLVKKFKPEELAFLEDVNSAYNLIVSSLPPQSESIRDRELYRYHLNNALANFDHTIYTKYNQALDNRNIYNNIRAEIFRLRKTINPDESKSMYYKLNLEVEQILHQNRQAFNLICNQYPDHNDYQAEIKRRNKSIIQQVQQSIKPVITRENKYALTYNADRLITAINVTRTEKNQLRDECAQIERDLKNINANSAISFEQKKLQIEQKLHQMEFNEKLQQHYSQLSQSLIVKYNEINQYLYIESPDAKSTLSDNVPFIQLWKSLTSLEPDLSQSYDYLVKKAIAEIAKRNETPIAKPWFFQFWKKPAYKEQQAQYAFEAILKNKQLTYNEKIVQIKQVINENTPLNYEVWFNGKAVNERMARIAEMKEKAYLLCMFEAFVNGEMEREILVKKIEALINLSKNQSRKEELDKLKDGLNILNVKYRLEEESAKSVLSAVIAPPQAVPGPAHELAQIPAVSADKATSHHLPTEGLSHHHGEHYFEGFRHQHDDAAHKEDELSKSVSIKVDGPGHNV